MTATSSCRSVRLRRLVRYPIHSLRRTLSSLPHDQWKSWEMLFYVPWGARLELRRGVRTSLRRKTSVSLGPRKIDLDVGRGKLRFYRILRVVGLSPPSLPPIPTGVRRRGLELRLTLRMAGVTLGTGRHRLECRTKVSVRAEQHRCVLMIFEQWTLDRRVSRGSGRPRR